MQFEQILKLVASPPYWARTPLLWQDHLTGLGIAHFAKDGRVGLFNLSWLMVNCEAPPTGSVYRQRDIMWVIQMAPQLRLLGRTLEEVSAMRTLCEFSAILDAEGTLGSVALKSLHYNAKKKLNLHGIGR